MSNIADKIAEAKRQAAEFQRRAEVMEAFGRGKLVEWRYRLYSDKSWVKSTGNPTWNWDEYDYRVARVPVKREAWLCLKPVYGNNPGDLLFNKSFGGNENWKKVTVVVEGEYEDAT